MNLSGILYKWEYFEKKPLGAPFVDAADSIAFNISEGYGRFHYKENKNFCYDSRGSAKETLTATEKAKQRKLISEEEDRLIFGYINSIGSGGDDSQLL